MVNSGFYVNINGTQTDLTNIFQRGTSSALTGYKSNNYNGNEY